MFKILILSLFVVGCAHSPKLEISDQAKQKHNQVFEEAYQSLESKSFVLAASQFEALLKQPISPSLRSVALYNLGVSYEEQKACGKAARTYKKLVSENLKEFPRVQAEGLFRLSQSYECLGDHKRVITTLNDVLKRASHLSAEQIEVEIPARLAAAHAKMGRLRVAKEYFNKAESRAFDLSAKAGKGAQKQNSLSKAFYLMGKDNLRSLRLKDSRNYLASLEMQQKYLLKSVELNSRSWSMSSAKALMGSYDNVFTLLKKIKTQSKKGLAKDRRLWAKRYKLLSRKTSSLINKAKAQRLPGSNRLALSNKVYNRLSVIQKQLR